MNKHKNKFKYKHSIATLTESVYSLKWFNMDFWRTHYFNYVVNDLKITKGDNLWTFDIIQFPYVTHNNVLKQPESDYAHRPKNLKPRVSVLFAFNAAGDYLQPFIVYPPNFDEEQTTTEVAQNEYISPNGFVTCRVFEHWLFKCFLPYIREQNQERTDAAKNFLLLFCGKLALIDKQLLSLVSAENSNSANLKLNFFTLNSESLQPFGFLLKVCAVFQHFFSKNIIQVLFFEGHA